MKEDTDMSMQEASGTKPAYTVDRRFVGERTAEELVSDLIRVHTG